MPSTYTSSLRLQKIGVGEQVNTWGASFNSTGGSDLLDFAISGVTDVALAATNVVLTTANGAADEARAAILNCQGALSADVAVIIPNVSKTYVVLNSTTGSFTLTVKTAGGSGPTIQQGASLMVVCDGNDSTITVGTTDSSAVQSIIDASIAAHNADGNAHLSASTEQRGMVELATNAETQTGTDATRSVTPASLSARTATTDRTGVVELATNAETVTGTDFVRATTPAGVAAAIAAAGGLTSATFGTVIGANYIKFFIPGGLMVMMGVTTSTYTGESATDSLEFTPAFTSIPYVIAGAYDSASQTPIVTVASGVSTTGFTFNITDRDTSGADFSTKVSWIAIGAGTP